MGGATWSKKPPFSSQVMNSAVFFQTFGFDTSASTIARAWSSPDTTDETPGCSVSSAPVRSHETCGSLSCFTSATKSSG